MAAQDSPYWQPIVADDWPAIEPAEWTGLEVLARDAAAAMRDGDIAQARRLFDEVVVSSAGLAPVRDAMAKDSGGATDFATALLAAADVFAANAETVHRTRHRILDVVDRTERRIEAAKRNTGESQPEGSASAPPGVVEPEPDDDTSVDVGSGAPEGGADVDALLAEARGQVREVVIEALDGVEAQTRPYLATIAQVLGQPEPGAGPAAAATTTSRASAPRPLEMVESGASLAQMADAAQGAVAPPMMPMTMMPVAAIAGAGAARAAPPPRTTVAALPDAVEKLSAPTQSANVPANPAASVPSARLRTAVGAAIEAEAAPSFVVGDRIDGDLVLARTLLTGVLTAAGARSGQSTAAMGWAVSVMRGPGGVTVFVTSNEGRGWLPTDVYLPRGVATPWQLDRVVGRVMSAWEGLADPARVLVEFAHRWRDRSGAKVTALASSSGIDDRSRATLGDARTQEHVRAATDPDSAGGLDLGSPGADLVDRLSLAEPGSAAGQADAGSYEWCVDVASRTDAGVARAVGTGLERMVREVGDARALRVRIANALRSGNEVPDQWWQDLWDADVLIEAAMMFRRVEVGRVDVGDVRVDPAAGTVLRDLVFERRCNELVMLLARDRSPQLTRDIAYAHGHVTGHPSFPMKPQAAGSVAVPVVGKVRQ
jgi:hypothetical protein